MSEKKGFLPIDDLQAALKLVRDAAKLRTTATVWSKAQRFQSITRLIHFDFNQNLLCLELSDLMDRALLAEEMQTAPFLFVTLKLHQQSLFFRAKFRQVVPGSQRIELELPTIVYRVQMRRHPRAIVHHRDDIRMFYPDPRDPNRVLKRTLYDLSEGGASAILFYGEERHHHVRQRIEAISLQIGPYLLKTWGTVRHLKVFPPDSEIQGVQLGLEFFGLELHEKTIISKLVEKELMSQFATVDEPPGGG